MRNRLTIATCEPNSSMKESNRGRVRPNVLSLRPLAGERVEGAEKHITLNLRIGLGKSSLAGYTKIHRSFRGTKLDENK